jgi:NADH-quinone oxidoreductase subunit C
VLVDLQSLRDQLRESLPETNFRDRRQVVVGHTNLLELMRAMKEMHGFNMLIDVTAVDYLEWPGASDRFGVIYQLLNVDTGERISVKTHVSPPDAKLPTVTGLWRGANWLEREVYDMFGIAFEGHPDLRRILMPDEFADHPLRKDYPLKGLGERHNFAVITRAEG